MFERLLHKWYRHLISSFLPFINENRPLTKILQFRLEGYAIFYATEELYENSFNH